VSDSFSILILRSQEQFVNVRKFRELLKHPGFCSLLEQKSGRFFGLILLLELLFFLQQR
jgi:hypothetical protein